MELKSERVEVADSLEAVELYFQRKWSDGLAIVPPTEDKVAEMIHYVGRHPQEVLGEIPPYNGIATIEKLAVNSVMAGCLPQYFPVVIAAVEAMLEPEHNLNGTQTTQSGAEPLLIVNGPIAKKLEINSGDGVFGRGFRANGTIGRAVRLILWNLGRNFPGDPDRSTCSHPGAWSYCIAENEDASPWEPLHVERGLPPGSSAVTVFCCDAPQGSAGNGTAQQILAGLSYCIATPGAGNYIFLSEKSELLVAISELCVKRFAEEGWSKAEVKQYLWEHARVPMRTMEETGWLDRAGAGGSNISTYLWPKWVDTSDPEFLLPATLGPEYIHVVVAGGPGAWCAVCHGWGVGGTAVTKEIKIPQGS